MRRYKAQGKGRETGRQAYPEVGSYSITLAVLPDVLPLGELRNSSSDSRKDRYSASGQDFPALSAADTLTGISSAQYCAHSLPPWPSNTPYTATERAAVTRMLSYAKSQSSM